MTKTKPSQKDQRQAFIDTARKVECDDSEAAFDGKLRRIAKAKSPAKAKRGKKS